MDQILVLPFIYIYSDTAPDDGGDFSSPFQVLPPGAMQQPPKRPILEKSNGAAAAVFNPGMFHYQQALANMQLHQPAFISSGESPPTHVGGEPQSRGCGQTKVRAVRVMR